MQILTKISSSDFDFGESTTPIVSFAKAGDSIISNACRVASIATLRSKEWDKRLGFMTGGSLGSAD